MSKHQPKSNVVNPTGTDSAEQNVESTEMQNAVQEAQMINPASTDSPESNVESVEIQNATPVTQMIELAKIQLREEYHFRVHDDEQTIADYAEIYGQFLSDSGIDKSATCPFDAVHVLWEDDAYIVVEGRLRFQAAKKAGVKELACIVLTDPKKATLIALSGNNKHGLPLNTGDKALCIEIAVKTFPEFSNRRIAKEVGCSNGYVDRIVQERQLRLDTPVVTGKDGKQYPSTKKSRKVVQQQEESADAGSEAAPSVTEAAPVVTEQIATPISTPKLADHWKAALESVSTDEQTRVREYVDVVKMIIATGFTDDKYRQDFLQMLRSEIIESGV